VVSVLSAESVAIVVIVVTAVQIVVIVAMVIVLSAESVVNIAIIRRRLQRRTTRQRISAIHSITWTFKRFKS
jgi:hypothetical protein